MTDLVVVVPLSNAPYPRSFLDDLNGFATGGSGRCRAALESEGVTIRASAPPVGEGWQPIETAPKDGTAVLLWFPDLPTNEVQIGCARPEELAGQQIVFWRDKDNGEPFETDAAGEVLPTHWMPLPQPPASSGEAGSHDQ